MSRINTTSPLVRVRSRRLAVLGWHPGTRELVEALIEHAKARTVAVGDTSAFALIRARGAMHASCFQHVLEMVRTVDYELLLIGDDAYGAKAAAMAAQRGATILLDGARLSAATIEAAANAALRHGVPFVLLRPALHTTAIEVAREQFETARAATPRFVSLDLEGDRPAVQSLGDAVGALLALTPATPQHVVAFASGGDEDDPTTIAVQVRFEDGAVASLTARVSAVRRSQEHSAARIRMSMRAEGVEVEADIVETGGAMTSSAPGRESRTRRLRASESLALEAGRVRHAAESSAHDIRAAVREAALLMAIEQALASGGVEAVDQPTPGLRLLQGGGRVASSAPATRLTLVSG